eukprot:8107985-Ditylum_brightwellii.AAC.2
MSGDKFLARFFIQKACRGRYNRLIEELHNKFLKEQHNYQDSVLAAYNILNGYQDKSKIRGENNLNNGFLSFGTIGDKEKEVGPEDVTALSNGGKTVGEEEVDDEGRDFQFTTLCHIVSDSEDSSKGMTELIERRYSVEDLDSSKDDESIPCLCIKEETSRDDTSDDENQDHHKTVKLQK